MTGAGAATAAAVEAAFSSLAVSSTTFSSNSFMSVSGMGEAEKVSEGDGTRIIYSHQNNVSSTIPGAS